MKKYAEKSETVHGGFSSYKEALENEVNYVQPMSLSQGTRKVPQLREAIAQHRKAIIARLTALQNGKGIGKPKYIHDFPEHWIDHPP